MPDAKAVKASWPDWLRQKFGLGLIIAWTFWPQLRCRGQTLVFPWPWGENFGLTLEAVVLTLASCIWLLLIPPRVSISLHSS